MAHFFAAASIAKHTTFIAAWSCGNTLLKARYAEKASEEMKARVVHRRSYASSSNVVLFKCGVGPK